MRRPREKNLVRIDIPLLESCGQDIAFSIVFYRERPRMRGCFVFGRQVSEFEKVCVSIRL